MAIMVTKRPEMLIGVSGSLNTMAAAEIVITSLKMPQIDRVTTEVRFKSLREPVLVKMDLILGGGDEGGLRKLARYHQKRDNPRR